MLSLSSVQTHLTAITSLTGRLRAPAEPDDGTRNRGVPNPGPFNAGVSNDAQSNREMTKRAMMLRWAMMFRWAMKFRWATKFRWAVGPWIAGTIAAWLAVWGLFGGGALAAIVSVAGFILIAWRSIKVEGGLRDAMARLERQRLSMEEALGRSQRMESLGRLTAGVAHDFNNHLTVINSNIEMLGRRLDPGQDRLLRHAHAAIQGVQRAAVLSSRLLSLSRQPVPEPEAVDVDRILDGLADLLRRTLSDRVNLDVTRSQEPWFTWADVNRMENALLSLAVNARDRVGEGGTLRIAVLNVRLGPVFEGRYPSVPSGEYIQIAVIDPNIDNPGLGSPNGDGPDGDGPDGDGRGGWQAVDDETSADLSMARAFAQAVGGFLLRSDPDAPGLALRLFLPRYVPLVPTVDVSMRQPGGRPTILVVEDEPLVRRACVEILRDLDFHVLEAPDAMEAFRLIADHGGIDLLFTDLGLPGGVSGRALADAARNVDASIKVLYTTGYQRGDLPDHAQAALLRKPFKSAQLAAKVHEVLAAKGSVAPSVTLLG